MRGFATAAAIALVFAALAGCGLTVKAADLFLLTRVGQGQKLTMLVNDSGTISCDGRPATQISDPLLLQARDLASALDKDAKSGLRLPRTQGSVFVYTIRLQDGTISFPDTAAGSHQELAQVELFAVQAAHRPCGLA
jgi:hypothetical protein